jgi:hypothetical protein
MGVSKITWHQMLVIYILFNSTIFRDFSQKLEPPQLSHIEQLDGTLQIPLDSATI